MHHDEWEMTMKWLPRGLRVASATVGVRLAACLAMLLAMGASAWGADESGVRWWLSTQDMKQQLAEQTPLTWQAGAAEGLAVDAAARRQTILGMGSSLEHTTCYNLMQLTPADRDEALTKLLDRERGIGMNLMRICMGTSDFTGDPWYSYDDMPVGQSDPQLAKFSIEKDRKYVLPALLAAKAKNPELLFFASPWSPPGWMKSTDSLIGGTLLPKHRAAYAQYFVKFIQAYTQAGIPIYAVTVQNEPGVDRSTESVKWHYPSCKWTGEEQRDFIKQFLAPALKQAGLDTKIWCYDHNYNIKPTSDGDDPGINFPRTILADAEAAAAVDGTAFHGYAGQPSGMQQLLDEFPEKPVYFTEGSQFGAAGALRIIELLRHGASSYNAWVTMIDIHDQPNNGPFKNNVTPLMYRPEDRQVEYRFDYFMYGQFMKFVHRGATRLVTPPAEKGRASVLLENPDGGRVLVAANAARGTWELKVSEGEQHFRVSVPARGVATCVWGRRK